ncbi:unnamed protein product [Urochloa humidicola]
MVADGLRHYGMHCSHTLGCSPSDNCACEALQFLPPPDLLAPVEAQERRCVRCGSSLTCQVLGVQQRLWSQRWAPYERHIAELWCSLLSPI